MKKSYLFAAFIFGSFALLSFHWSSNSNIEKVNKYLYLSKDKTSFVVPLLDCSDTISFNRDVLPTIIGYCSGCHDARQSLSLTNHAEISHHASAILNTLNGVPFLMPDGGPPLADSLIQQFECWINQGKLDN
jgi:hypothetical protein